MGPHAERIAPSGECQSRTTTGRHAQVGSVELAYPCAGLKKIGTVMDVIAWPGTERPFEEPVATTASVSRSEIESDSVEKWMGT